MKLLLDQLIPNPEQPRKEFGQAEMQSLADSIREHGLLNPISVEGPQEDGKYIILDGERRWRAHKIAGLKEIEVHVARPAMNGAGGVERLMLGIIGNMQRKDLNLIERAVGYRKLRDLGLTYDEIGKACNMAPSMVGTNMALLDLPLEIQMLYATGKLPFDARLVKLFRDLDEGVALRLARSASDKQMPTRAIIWYGRRLQDADGYDENNKRQSVVARNNPSFTARAEFGHWNALAQLRITEGSGILCIEENIKQAAISTCKNCALYEDASQNVCRACPMVEMLRLLHKEANHA